MISGFIIWHHLDNFTGKCPQERILMEEVNCETCHEIFKLFVRGNWVVKDRGQGQHYLHFRRQL